MKSLTKLATVFGAMGLLAATAPANAIPTLTFTSPNPSYGTQVVDPFTGFDWVGTSSAVTAGFIPDGTTVFTTTYLSSAVGIFTAGGGVALVDGLTPNGAPATRWEFTIKATINETASCANIGCTSVNFNTVSGSWDIYYDSSADANRLTGTGFINGTRVLGGTMNTGYAGQFTDDGSGNGTGDFDFAGDVTFTQTDSTKDAYIDPVLASTIAGANLRLGTKTTGGWVAPTSWVDGGGIPSGAIVFQADGQQGFLVPEPGTLALLGLSMLGFGFTSRRRKG